MENKNNSKKNYVVIKPVVFNLIDNYKLNKQKNKTYSLEFKRNLILNPEGIFELYNNYNVFTFSSMLNNSECVSVLIEFYLENKDYFNSLNYPNLLCHKDLYGQNGLLVSCLFNNYNSAKLFLENGCYVDVVNKNNEPCLLIALYGKSFNLIKLLVHYNATITDEIIKISLDLSNPDMEDDKNEHVEYQKITEYLLKKRGNFDKYNSEIFNRILELFPKLFKSKNQKYNITFKTLKDIYRCHCLNDSDSDSDSVNKSNLEKLSRYANINSKGKTKQELCKEISYKLMLFHKDL